MARSFGVHVSNYAWAEGAVAVAGLLSFPILTRLLSVADYGTMNLVASVLGLTVALGKMGVQHAALRMWPEVQARPDPDARSTFEATVVWGMLGSGVAVTLIWALLAAAMPDRWWSEPGAGAIMLLASPLIALRVLESALVNQLRAQEDSTAMALYSTARRYAGLVGVVGVLWWLRRDLWGFYGATIAVELLMVAGLMVWMFRGRSWPQPSRVSMPLYGSLAVYGLPMLGSEMSNVVLTMSDRFIIQNAVGAESLGIYAASYNMCDQLRGFLLGSLVGAAYPRCLHLWESEGAAGLRHFLNRFMHHYSLVALYLVALMAVVGGDLLVVLSSSRYAQGATVTGWIMAGLALQTVAQVAAVGIFLAKRTMLVMVLMVGSGVLSIAANVFLVGRLGIQGAAFAALGVYALLLLVQMAVAQRLAPVIVPWRGLLTGAPVAVGAAWAASHIHLDVAWLNLLLRGAVLTLLYLGAVLAVDTQWRRWMVDAVRQRKAR